MYSHHDAIVYQVYNMFPTFCSYMIFHLSIYTILFPLYLYNTPVNFICKIPPQCGCTQAKPQDAPTYLLCALRARQENARIRKGYGHRRKRVLDNNTFNHLQLFTCSNPTRTWVEYGLHYSLQEKVTMRRVNQYPISNTIWS